MTNKVFEQIGAWIIPALLAGAMLWAAVKREQRSRGADIVFSSLYFVVAVIFLLLVASNIGLLR